MVGPRRVAREMSQGCDGLLRVEKIKAVALGVLARPDEGGCEDRI
jgi:hypothetical protein